MSLPLRCTSLDASSGTQVAETPPNWPVAHIMLFVSKVSDSSRIASRSSENQLGDGWAVGRQAVAQMGHQGLVHFVYSTCVLSGTPQRSRDGPPWNYAATSFAKTCYVYGTFSPCNTYGEHDVGPVRLTHVGWAALIEKVVRIDVLFE